ncbi:MAG: hypothetical protein F6K41_12280, partial [Symploca sp. SIO3E6]|nr:hypothetical protein [Caldora sp. SIO3E6]
CHRVTIRWQDLAIYLEIPLADRATFSQGHEPLRTLEWLEQHTQQPSEFKNKLRQAFEELGWNDLIDELDGSK